MDQRRQKQLYALPVISQANMAPKFTLSIHLSRKPWLSQWARLLAITPSRQCLQTKRVQQAADKIISAGKEIAKEYNQTVSQTHTQRGDPVDEIIACAEQCKADLIVTGRRGLGSIGSLIQGSTSQGISRNATCAVLTVA